MIPLLLLACQTADAPKAIDSPSPDTDAVTPVDTVEAPPLKVRVTPAEPRWNDDLTCVVNGLPEGWTAEIRWDRNRFAWTGVTATTTWPDDLIPHLAQAGGQRWRCLAVPIGPRGAADDAVASDEVIIRPPLDMIRVRAGRPFKYREWDDALLTRDFLMQRLEMTVLEFRELGGFVQPSVRPRADDLPVRARWHDVVQLANVISQIDGLTPCHQCNGSDEDTECDFVDNIYTCDGYRLPTQAEWVYAARAEGSHTGMLPSGVDFLPVEPDESGCRPVPIVTGPPGRSIFDECWWMCHPDAIKSIMKGGLLIPNSIGLYDLCGNEHELLSDPNHGEPSGKIDPYYRRDPMYFSSTPKNAGGGMVSPSYALAIDHDVAPTSAGGARLVRTLEPMGDAP